MPHPALNFSNEIRTWPLPVSEVRRWRRKLPARRINFAQSLAADHALLLSSAGGVEVEYRRWLYLCAVHRRRLQGSDWMATAEQQHRKDAANWQRLLDGPLAGVEMADPVLRNAANDPDYAETLALYAQAFPDGVVFGKVWPGLWKGKVERKVPARFMLGVTLGGMALFLASHWGLMSVKWLETLGIVMFVSGLASSFCLSLVMPWQNDDG